MINLPSPTTNARAANTHATTAQWRRPAIINALAARIANGETIAMLAAELGITEQHLYEALTTGGVSVEPRAGTARGRVREKQQTGEIDA